MVEHFLRVAVGVLVLVAAAVVAVGCEVIGQMVGLPIGVGLAVAVSSPVLVGAAWSLGAMVLER